MKTILIRGCRVRTTSSLYNEVVRTNSSVFEHPVATKHCGTGHGFLGHVEAKHRSHGPVKGLVFGAWSEASPDAHALLSAAIDVGARRHWRSMACTSAADARGALAWLLHRRWGVTAARENARLLLSRLSYVGAGAEAAAARREGAFDGDAARTRRAACHDWRGPRCRLERRGF